ncbi:DNA polymerase alpha/epsilon subunit B-domain-containing protein [Tirmania nivea]|nr:DNA polymerase alpha/epsilon subunit B-domain-containing protein [Tirmania nivea]
MPLDKGKGVSRPADAAAAAFFRRRDLPIQSSALLTSDPFVPLPPSSAAAAPRILAVEISPSALRPLAFRIFTKKHNLTLKSDALALLCTFIGRRCGSDWRDSGAGDRLLDEIARTWKRNAGPAGILVDGGEALKAVLKGLDVPGAAGGARLLGRERTFDAGAGGVEVDEAGDTHMAGEDASAQDPLAGGPAVVDPRKYLKVVSAFTQPKWVYNPLKKHFERAPKPSLLPPPASKTFLFKHRYHTLHQRLLRNDSFLPPTFIRAAKRSSASSAAQSHYTITPISHLLGQHSSTFLLFGLLTVSPAGHLSLADPTGSIPLDITYATPVPSDGAYFCPGCFVVVDGQYSEDPMKFLVLTIGMPPCERREASAEIFGHVDFLGTGVTLDANSAQTRALRRVESAVPGKMVFLAEVQLDVDRTLDALRAVLRVYQDDPPLACVLMGSFIRIPFGGAIVGAGGGGGVQGAVQYKEYWDRLALLLAEFGNLARNTVFIFVPGDNDPFTAAFSGGRSPALPRENIPEIFVNRVKRVLAAGVGGSAEPDTRGGVWASNPARISYFSSDIVLFRDDASARFSRHAIRFPTPTTAAGKGTESMDLDPPPPAGAPPIPPSLHLSRKLTKTLLDQAHLSPFPLASRPVLWDYAPHTLALYPLPRLLVMADVGVEGFAVTYEGCHVVNPGRLVADGGGGVGGGGRKAGWVEVEMREGRGTVREVDI